jgi:hypothetical protein
MSSRTKSPVRALLSFSRCLYTHLPWGFRSGVGNSTSSPKSLRLVSGAHMIPHPEKRHKGGEDAYFLSEDGQVLGVADGVGGWALSGVDSGLYSKSLMFGIPPPPGCLTKEVKAKWCLPACLPAFSHLNSS